MKFRNLYKTLKKITRESYYSDLLQNCKDDVIKTWNSLHPLIGKQKVKGKAIPELIIGGKVINDSASTVNNFWEFFSKVGKTLQSTIPEANASQNDHLKCREDNSIFCSVTATVMSLF